MVMLQREDMREAPLSAARERPRACSCPCHSNAVITHIVPCCGPGAATPAPKPVPVVTHSGKKAGSPDRR